MEDFKNEDLEDLGFVSLVLEGNKKAFRNIVNKYERLMHKLSLNFLGKNADTEDAVQEIFLEIYKSLANFKLSKKFLPWIYSIALNVLRKKYRKIIKIKKTAAAVQKMERQQETNPMVVVEKQEIQRIIRNTITSLPPALREVIVLYYIEDLKVKEICDILELGPENVKSRLFRARKKLKKLFTKAQLI